MAIIELKNIVKTFPSEKVGEGVHAVRDVSLAIEEGDIFGIIGYSGAGKSTLVRCINLLEKPTSGEVIVEGKNITGYSEVELRAVRRRMGMIFQHFNLLNSANVFENVAAPLKNQGKLSGKEIKERVEEMLRLTGLEDKERAYPSQLSGGQKQRVAIARALVGRPKILLCDEATSALDPKTTEQILSLLKKINREMGVTIIIITHQMSVIESICDEVAIIDHSHIAECGPVKEVFQSPKTEIGKRLILGEGEKEAFFGSGRRFRIVFDGRKAHEPILSELILALHTPVNILFANTKEVDGMAVGQMVIELPENIEDILHVTEFMKERGIAFEEVRR